MRGINIRRPKPIPSTASIADVIRFGRYRKTSVELGDLQAMCELYRQRFCVTEMASDLKRFPEYEKLFSDPFGASSMEILSRYTAPEEIHSVSPERLAELLDKASRGRLDAAKAHENHNSVKNSFVIVLTSSSFALIIRQYIEQIRSLEASVDVFDGPALAAVILSDIGGEHQAPFLTCKTGGFCRHRSNCQAIRRLGTRMRMGVVRLTCDALFGSLLPLPPLRPCHSCPL